MAMVEASTTVFFYPLALTLLLHPFCAVGVEAQAQAQAQAQARSAKRSIRFSPKLLLGRADYQYPDGEDGRQQDDGRQQSDVAGDEMAAHSRQKR